MTNAAKTGSPLDQNLIDALRKVVAHDGVVGAAKRLNISRSAIERGLGSLGLRAGTALQVRLALASQTENEQS